MFFQGREDGEAGIRMMIYFQGIKIKNINQLYSQSCH